MANQKDNDALRRIGIDNIEGAAVARATRSFMPAELVSTLFASGNAKYREVYDLNGRSRLFLPGALVRREGDPPAADPIVNQAYDYAGATYDFYFELFNRNSLDDRGMILVSSVHLDEHNAFWNGQQMIYGKGLADVFSNFTNSLDVVGHEFTHGVVSYTCRLDYNNEPGAINEHLADVFGTLIKQRTLNQDVQAASWLLGEDIVIPPKAPLPQTRRAIRDMKQPGTAYVNDPYLGTDQQVDHYTRKYVGPRDFGGVHWNSGILNRAFAHAAITIGGYAWETLGTVWYDTMLQLRTFSTFADFVAINLNVAQQKFGLHDKRYQAVKDAWRLVGL